MKVSFPSQPPRHEKGSVKKIGNMIVAANESENGDVKRYYIATTDANILYTYKNGGGIKGRKVKKGDVVTKLGERIDISIRSVRTLELLGVIEKSEFDRVFQKVDR